MNENQNCIFCKLINKQIPCNVVLENEDFIVINDINPKAKTHLLIIPKKHSQDLNQFIQLDKNYNQYFEIIKILSESLEENHYKIKINTGSKSGQEVFHFHTHFISSSALKSTVAE